MKLAVPTETRSGENRVALVPESCKKLVKAGVTVFVQGGAGTSAGFSDDSFRDAGATIEPDAAALLRDADLTLHAQPPAGPEIQLMREGSMLLTTLLPSRNLEIVRNLVERKITCFATDCLPRITRAQSMDTLSSMSNISGYKGVLLAADALDKYFPMLMTAAGTVLQANVFVIGAGVAGLQAIATSKRLGAKILATDVRPEVKEQIESLGAKYVGIELKQSAAAGGGYAKELSADDKARQAELLASTCAAADVVITTALTMGGFAPKLISADTVRRMRPGSVIVDLAAEGGGNCELTKPGETTLVNGVKIVAPLNLPATMPLHASTLYSRNLTNFVMEFWKDNAFNLDPNDDIIKGAMITRNGEVLHGPTKTALQAGAT